MSLPANSQQRHYFLGLSVRRIHLFIYLSLRLNRSCFHCISWTAWAISMKLTVNSLVAPADYLIWFWRSKVKVTAGRRTGRGIHVGCRSTCCDLTGWHKIQEIWASPFSGFFELCHCTTYTNNQYYLYVQHIKFLGVCLFLRTLAGNV